MRDKDKKLNVGKDSVVIGDVSGNVGDRSVVVGPTDNQGNVILNQPMAVGHNAHAGPDSIAIGANAGAGYEIEVVFSEINKLIRATDNPSLIKSFNDLCYELNRHQKDKSKILQLWNTIKSAAALNGAIGLVEKAAKFIGPFLS